MLQSQLRFRSYVASLMTYTESLIGQPILPLPSRVDTHPDKSTNSEPLTSVFWSWSPHRDRVSVRNKGFNRGVLVVIEFDTGNNGILYRHAVSTSFVWVSSSAYLLSSAAVEHFVASLTHIASLVLSKPARCGSAQFYDTTSQVGFALSTATDGASTDLQFQISAPQRVGWGAIGTGYRMAGSLMFIIYPSAQNDGKLPRLVNACEWSW